MGKDLTDYLPFDDKAYYLHLSLFAPNSKHRVDVTPAKRGKGSPSAEDVDRTPEQRHQAMTGFLLLQNRHTVHPWA